MAAIKSKDTKPELTVRRAVHASGYRYRLQARELPGRPDLVFPRHRLVVFIHGCFWHGHACGRAHLPRTNTAYWFPKIEKTLARDRRAVGKLRRAGWSVLTIRECTIRSGLARLISYLDRSSGAV